MCVCVNIEIQPFCFPKKDVIDGECIVNYWFELCFKDVRGAFLKKYASIMSREIDLDAPVQSTHNVWSSVNHIAEHFSLYQEQQTAVKLWYIDTPAKPNYHLDTNNAIFQFNIKQMEEGQTFLNIMFSLLLSKQNGNLLPAK